MKNNAKLLYVVYTMKLKKSRKFYHLLKILRTKHRAFREECTADTRVLAQIRAVLYNYIKCFRTELFRMQDRS